MVAGNDYERVGMGLLVVQRDSHRPVELQRIEKVGCSVVVVAGEIYPATLDHEEESIVAKQFDRTSRYLWEARRIVAGLHVYRVRQGLLSAAPPHLRRPRGDVRDRIEAAAPFYDDISVGLGDLVDVALLAVEPARKTAAHEKVEAAFRELKPDFVKVRPVRTVRIESGGGRMVYRDARHYAHALAGLLGDLGAALEASSVRREAEHSVVRLLAACDRSRGRRRIRHERRGGMRGCRGVVRHRVYRERTAARLLGVRLCDHPLRDTHTVADEKYHILGLCRFDQRRQCRKHRGEDCFSRHSNILLKSIPSAASTNIVCGTPPSESRKSEK